MKTLLAILFLSASVAFAEPQFVSTRTSGAITSTTTEAAFTYSKASGTELIQSTDLNKEGAAYRVTVAGTYSTTDTTAGTFTVKVKAGSVTLISSGAITPGDDLTDKAFHMEAVFTVQTPGASGTIMTVAHGAFFTGSTPKWIEPVPATATVNTTANQAITATLDYSVEDPTNSSVVNILLIEKL